MPLGPYRDFDECVARNGDRRNPEAYCAAIERAVKGAALMPGEEPPGDAPGDDFHAMLVIEDTWTGDGRWIDEGALTWRELPLPLMAIDRTTDGHYDALLIGNIERIEREGRELHAWGRFVPGAEGEAARLQQLIREGFLRGVSVDLDALEYELVMPGDEPQPSPGPAATRAKLTDPELLGDLGREVLAAQRELRLTDAELLMRAMAVIGDGECPPATQDVAVNIRNRQHAIDEVGYGPLNPAEPNDDFWQGKADRWGVTPEEAQQQRCGNCAAFIRTESMLACIEQGLAAGGGDEDDAWAVVDAGELGYCEALDFKCHGQRTCDAWIMGGPITDEPDEGEEEGDGVEIEIELSTLAEQPETEPLEEPVPMLMEEARMRITAARIMGATVVPFPAFEEAFIESLPALVASLAGQRATGYVRPFAAYTDMDFTPPTGARQEAERGLAWREEYGRGGTAVGVARARDIKNGVSLSPTTITRMRSYFARHEIDKEGQGWRPGEEGYPSAGRIAWALWGGDPGRAWAEKLGRQMESRDREGSIVASALAIDAPVMPPRSWFADPQLTGPTPLRVTDEGRIMGHLAVWGQCHIGWSDQCVTPPRSASRYSHFLTGELLCDDGSRVPVGQITMDTGHAPLSAAAHSAAAHYDDTGCAIADVTCGEDRYGVWVTGALRPNLPPERVRAVMAADVSGDWRRIGSALELIAILSVNVPGFPKSRVAAREELGLVAALVARLSPGEGAEPQPPRPAADSPRPEFAATVARIARSIGRDPQSRLAELRARVHGRSL